MTLDELRERCSSSEARTALADEPPAGPGTAEAAGAEVIPSPIGTRLASERAAAAQPFSILAHRPNFFMPVVYNREGWSPELFRRQSGDPGFENKNVEGQFQISLKVPLAVGLFNGRMDLYGAYTNHSFWQMYNSDFSEPFRETNHEPEVWAQFENDWEVLGLINTVNTFGWVHQSNGRSGVLSRSWDRLAATFVFERGRWVFAVRPWIWLTTDKGKSDNPDIDDYMGHGELRAVYGRKGHVFSAMLRNQLESGFERGAVELSWSFPVFDYPYLKGYVQYFYGYGESLIDYNNKVNRIGIGISITDWLD
ncbi:MAG: phospholipase A [Xanthomonadales bacterium]|nr:phospholipase A [Gammaproteobacteria bacterium]MBT8054750.1 phospholipase A [Gammaproteobacteria bacterium]NND58543.1 phospholipase A [Xanthomonadales bacterium]NNK52237.1 phospholipase A [Xanthomonadales bacterium]